ncbi:hypothetical protein [Aestuariibaculum suncheonense]|uniref:hypothetical protein n=1 Tax=Aestuariibaculum suncheonense TaxID=1028745 RepID=UPI001F510A26|nr:hypothetical protein [Aestuariibaculum suncheonense]
MNKCENLLFITTNKDHEITRQINDLVGKPFSFWTSLKLKGIGSKRMIIEDTSPNFDSILNQVSDLNYANIELRPQGILVHITKGLNRFVWVIPYFKLSIYKTNGLSIHANGSFIRFRKSKTFNENRAFFNKLLNLKLEFTKHYNFNIN